MGNIQFRPMKTAPKDGRIILVDTFPERSTPSTAYWCGKGKWWRDVVTGNWENHAVGWTDFPPPELHKRETD